MQKQNDFLLGNVFTLNVSSLLTNYEIQLKIIKNYKKL